MSLFLAELRKVWGNRLFPLLLAVLAAANLLLLWMGTRPTAGHPPDRGAAVRRGLPRRRRAARRPDNGRKGRVPAREIYRD